MKTLFVVGSPRKNGNTSEIVKKTIESITKDMQAETLYLSDFELNGCLGCSYCQQFESSMGCFQKDDITKILHKVISADLLIYGTPLYGHSYSGQLKLFMDRHIALMKLVSGAEKAVSEMEIHSLIKGKPCALLVSCQGPSKDNTELIKAQFDRFCESFQTECLGTYIFPWCAPNPINSNYSTETFQRISTEIERLEQRKNY